MKFSHIFSGSVLAALLTLGTLSSLDITSAQAQTAAAPKIAVVDLNEAMNSVEEGKAAIATLEKRFAERKGDLEKRQKELQEMQANLERQSSVLSDAAKRTKAQELQEKFAQYQQSRMEAENEMGGMRAQLQDDIAEKLKKVCAELAVQGGYTLVIEKNVVWYSLPAYDITPQLIKTYNSRSTKPAPKK